MELLPVLKREAKKRQGTRTDIGEKIPGSDLGKSREKAAGIVGVNPHYVTDAETIKNDAPELFKKIKANELTISKAKKQIKADNKMRRRRSITPRG